MKRNLTPIASGVALLLAGVAMSAQAQQADNTQQVVVTGIRASLQSSLKAKRNAVTNVEVVTAEDVGKMPDKNVADTLQRLPGVNISTSAAGSGGFDENDRVSLRGTAPSLTQTLINGHSVSSGDWFVLDQGGSAVGRSVSFSLLPSEVIGQVKVYKSSTADQIEGGTAGTVDILTRHPLDFKNNLSVSGAIEAVYSDLPGKTEPQANVLVAWHNDAKSFGVMLQGFDEKRSLRRDGQELINWYAIPASAVGTHTDLTGVWAPGLIGSSLFEQTRHRTGGVFDVQFKPTDALSVDLSLFESKLDATNYNRNYMMWNQAPSSGGLPAVVPDTYTIRNGILTAASWTNPGPGHRDYAIVDEIYRPDAGSKSQFADLDVKWKVSNDWTLKFKAGSTKGEGNTPDQDVYEGQQGGGAGAGVSYSLNNLGAPATVAFKGFNPSSFTGTGTYGDPNWTGTGLNWIFGELISMTDKEKYAQLDSTYNLDSGVFNTLNFGVRGAKHERYNNVIAQGPNWANTVPSGSNATNPAWNGTTYPSDFASSLGGSFPRQPWMLDSGILGPWGDLHSNRNASRTYYTDMYSVTEKSSAAYVSTDMSGEGWTANAGVRYVHTKDESLQYQILPTNPGNLAPYLWGGFLNPQTIDNDYNNVLPSASFKLKATKDIDVLASVSRTMTRPDWGALAGSVSVDDNALTGNGGNPYLAPTTSNNYDLSLQWYYAPRALLSAGVFHMDLQNYVGYSITQQTLVNTTQSQKQGTAVFNTYNISSPSNVNASVTGLEFAAQIPLSAGFGVDGNLTLADSKEAFGGCATPPANTSFNNCDMVGASKTTYNVGGYFENDRFNARISWAWRSAYLAAFDRGVPLYQDAIGTLSASANYNITPNLTVSFTGMNLNNPILKNYIYNPDMPSRFYENGRQYYLGLRFKF